MSNTRPLVLRPGDRQRLDVLAEGVTAQAKRAQILLLAADGRSNSEIARQVLCSRATVVAWRKRYQRLGFGGLEDRARSGRPVEISEPAVILRSRPTTSGAGHAPSARALARELELSPHSILRVWRRWQIEPSDASTLPLARLQQASRIDLLGLFLANSFQCVAVRMCDGESPESTSHAWTEAARALASSGRRRSDSWSMNGYQAELRAFLEVLEGAGQPESVVLISSAAIGDMAGSSGKSRPSFEIMTAQPGVRWFDVLELVVAVDLEHRGFEGWAATAAQYRSDLETSAGQSVAPFAWFALTKG